MTRYVIACAAFALAAGCATYTPKDIPAMSTVDICELENMQRNNLSPQARHAIASELQRRKDTCRNHTAEVEKRFEDFMYVERYGRQLP